MKSKEQGIGRQEHCDGQIFKVVAFIENLCNKNKNGGGFVEKDATKLCNNNLKEGILYTKSINK